MHNSGTSFSFGELRIFGRDKFEFLSLLLLTTHDTPAKQQPLCALRLTDLIRLCLGTFRMPGFAET